MYFRNFVLANVLVTQGFGLFDGFMTDFFFYLVKLGWFSLVFFGDTLELMHKAQSLILSLLNFICLV